MQIEVLIEIPAKQLDKTFTYNVPKKLIGQVEIGKRVLIKFNNRFIEGFITKIHQQVRIFDYELNNIIEIIDEFPVLNKEMLEVAKYISYKYLTTKISSYQTMLPSALKAKQSTNIKKKYVTFVKLEDKNYSPKNKQQEEIINLLKANDQELPILRKINTSINTLIKNSVVSIYKIEEYRLSISTKEEEKTTLNEEQKKAFEKVKENLNKFTPYLLYGVTGSGKTEVYIHLIKEVLKQKKEAIVLVPEISLTPQMINKFKISFNEGVAVLHSALSEGEKYDEWRKIQRKEVSIVIGARSAIFAPFTNLGIIIIDEEHSNTYKQENNPKYNALDIAFFRARKYNIPVILGSATPTIESYTYALKGNYELLILKNKYNNQNSPTYLIDMKEEIKKGNRIISEKLNSLIIKKLNKKEQIIILLNRRGYTTILTCNNCGHVNKCPNCDIPFTYHKTSNNQRCHYCSLGVRKEDKCEMCQSEELTTYGMGTQKLEEYLKETYKARVIRMDADTTSRKGSHERIIYDFRNNKYDILVGTQMISKGLDFHNVTLVGVIAGDATLNMPDFRSAEKTFSLLSQITGRTGRGEKQGISLIQGFNMDHYSIEYAQRADYIGFYNKEIAIRKLLGYPPFYNICLIKISGLDFSEVSKESNKVSNYLKNNLKSNIILGPSVSSIPKINKIYYFQIMIKYKKTDDLIRELTKLKNIYQNNKINLDFDLNPMQF